MCNSQKKELVIALLIDGDNTQSAYIGAIEKELALIGVTSYKRVYYTYNDGIPNGWGGVCNDHALSMRAFFPYTKPVKKVNNKLTAGTVKNVADSGLIIEAMDILYSNKVDCVCIVASDSDYTNITKRLRESNIRVIGMGEKTTPIAFINACDEFRYLETLYSEYKTSEAEGEIEGENGIVPKEEIENFITNMLVKAGKFLDAGEIKKKICLMWPGFDETDYLDQKGNQVTKMSRFFDTRKFKVIHEPGGNVNIDLLKR
ncbi:MAG: NYN domain-containing protein [Clostridia bacterium]|nr:NYN domain-containing protein [Clostridia bacterium]